MTGIWHQDLADALRALPQPDMNQADAARARQQSLTKPPGALGKLEALAIWLAGWQGRAVPALERVRALVFAGNHGVAAQGVSPYPASVTAQMVANFEAGGAAINQLCRAYAIGLDVIPLDLDRPTGDFSQGPAMSAEDCLAAIAAGRAAVKADSDILLIGEMGIGNTTSAAALCAALLGGPAREWAGPGTGLAPSGVAHKARIIDKAVDFHRAEIRHPFDALARLGGREIAAMAGALLEARLQRIPTLLDGYVCGAAALVLEKAQPGALDHVWAGHVSAEPGHRNLLAALGKEPLLNLDMRLGEGSGAAMALGVLRGAVATHSGMASFAEAGIDNRE